MNGNVDVDKETLGPLEGSVMGGVEMGGVQELLSSFGIISLVTKCQNT
jgi:hypothetical protein